jgi:hypothetical protein
MYHRHYVVSTTVSSAILYEIQYRYWYGVRSVTNKIYSGVL